MDEITEFDEFVVRNEPRLRRALTAAYGPHNGPDASAAAFAWAWEHWEQVNEMKNPVGWLYRVGQSSQQRRKQPVVFPEPPRDGPRVEPKLVPALSALTPNQRVAVVLVHGFGHTLEEAATVLDVGVSTLRNHLRRGMSHLRDALGVHQDV